MADCLVIRMLTAAEDVSVYAPLTAVALRPMLTCLLDPPPQQAWRPAQGDCVAWGIHNGSCAIGLLLARVEFGCDPGTDAEHGSLVVLSMAVRKPWRRLGLARKLLQQAQRWAQLYQLAELVVDVPLAQSCTPALDALTPPSQGWLASKSLLLVTIDNARSFAPLQRRMSALADRQQRRWGWRVAPLTKALLERHQQQVVDAYLPEWARAPWLDCNTQIESLAFDRSYCRVLLSSELIIGWIVCHRPAADLLRYSTVWVEPPWDRRGALFALLVNVVRDAHFAGEQHLEADQRLGVPIPKACFGVQPHNVAMHRLSVRLFQPLSSHWVETECRSLRLVQNQSAAK